MKNINKIIYISFGFVELEEQLYSRKTGVKFLGRDSVNRYNFEVDLNVRGTTPRVGLNKRNLDVAILKSAQGALSAGTVNWTARYIDRKNAATDAIAENLDEFTGVNEHTKIIITGHGNIEVDSIWSHYDDTWAYNHSNCCPISLPDTKLEGRCMKLSVLAAVIAGNLKKYSLGYITTEAKPLHISLSSCLMAYAKSFRVEKSGAACLLKELKKKGVYAEIRARSTSAITPNSSDKQCPLGYGTGDLQRKVRADMVSTNAAKKDFAKAFQAIASRSINSHGIRTFNFTFKWTGGRMVVLDSNAREAFEICKNQVVTNLYEIAYTTGHAAKKTEILAKIPGVEAMTTALEIKNSLKAWVGTTTAALHTTGIFYFGTARSVKSVNKMIGELETGTPVTPYCNSKARVRVGKNYFLMQQKDGVLENLYYLGYTARIKDGSIASTTKCKEILDKVGQLQAMDSFPTMIGLLHNWANNTAARIHVHEGTFRFGKTRTYSTVMAMISSLSKNKPISRLA